MPTSARRKLATLCAAFMLLAACSKPAPEPHVHSEPASGVDYHSYANTEDYRTTHVDLDFTVDFERRVLVAEARLQLERLNDANNPLVLDTRGLRIDSVRAGRGGDYADVPFSIGASSEDLGAPLSIEMPADATAVAIRYETSPDAIALQWLEPQQTAGKRHPFLYTQAQSIHARSFIPLQDTPGVRITYDATVRTPPELRAVMSADNDPAAELDGEFSFSMPQAVPPYLIALAVGDLEFVAMGPRTGVYAEDEILEAAAAEFSDTEAMLETTEQTFGPYRWDRYDLLILPPAFPIGGMENPRLSFITPTVIAGDKSLVALIAHELAHSWSGNLVTNASWRDLWLNEGFTTYLTNRIMQAVYGDERYYMEMALGYDELKDEVPDLEDRDEALAVDLRGRDPDDVFTSIAYEKGSLFLYELELAVGREAFDRFLVNYFNEHAFQSVSTEVFLDYLERTLAADHPESVSMERVRQWVFEPGIPQGAPVPRSAAFADIEPVRQAWLAGRIAAEDIDTGEWTYHHWKRLLDGMPRQLSRDQLEDLDRAFDLTAAPNNEIAFSWLRIAIRNGYEPAFGRLERFLASIGRSKFIGVLYEDMMDAGMGETARRIFAAAGPTYHPLAAKEIQATLEGD
ncbi:MAG TPA: M1 family metallopeptidase [Woeseiaceae bacterium]|nr:M1 family metallopeptidase [Woeseiaceae bacterium]